MVSMEHLPQELVAIILSRLPARELLKFKCVCKSWFDIITDPHFVTNYYVVYNNPMHYNNCQEEHLLVIRRPFLSRLKTGISIVSWNFNEPKGLVSYEVINLNFEHKYWHEIMGPCNGIYFLQGKPNVMMNPSLRQFKALPESHLAGSHGSCYCLTDYPGFGFDPKTNDYKVIALKGLWLKETHEGQRRIKLVAELYSLNSNSWRKLDAALPLHLKIGGSSRLYTYVNNCCHWWGYVDVSGDRTGDVVLAFDMVNELFRKIKVPEICCSSGSCFTTLAPFNDSATIGVIVYPVRGAEKVFDVWVMKDYWNEGSWIKQYSIGPVPIIGKLVEFYGNNRFLWEDSNGGLVLYEPDYECTTRDLQVCRKYEFVRAARYVESLVSLQRAGKQKLAPCSLVQDHLLN